MHSKILVAAALFAGAYATAMPCRAQVAEISAEALNSAVFSGEGKPLMVDVRSPYDFEKKHIAGAVNAPFNIVVKSVPPGDAPLVLYCGDEKCPLSHLAARTLAGAGRGNVKVLAGGLAEWEKKGFKVESGGVVKQARKPARSGAISCAALKKRMKKGKPLVLDSRPESEFAAGHVPGAKNLPLESLVDRLKELPENSEIVAYDVKNARAAEAVKILAAAGFKALELSGGLQMWAAGKNALETGAAK